MNLVYVLMTLVIIIKKLACVTYNEYCICHNGTHVLSKEACVCHNVTYICYMETCVLVLMDPMFVVMNPMFVLMNPCLF